MAWHCLSWRFWASCLDVNDCGFRGTWFTCKEPIFGSFYASSQWVASLLSIVESRDSKRRRRKQGTRVSAYFSLASKTCSKYRRAYRVEAQLGPHSTADRVNLSLSCRTQKYRIYCRLCEKRSKDQAISQSSYWIHHASWYLKIDCKEAKKNKVLWAYLLACRSGKERS